MVACLFKEIEKVFARDKLEEKEKERGRLECAMKCNDVGMRWKRLVNRRL